MLLEVAECTSESVEGYQLLLLLSRAWHVIEGLIEALTWLCTADVGRSNGRLQHQVMTAARTAWWWADTCLKSVLDSSVSKPLSATAIFPFFLHLPGH